MIIITFLISISIFRINIRVVFQDYRKIIALEMYVYYSNNLIKFSQKYHIFYRDSVQKILQKNKSNNKSGFVMGIIH